MTLVGCVYSSIYRSICNPHINEFSLEVLKNCILPITTLYRLQLCTRKTHNSKREMKKKKKDFSATAHSSWWLARTYSAPCFTQTLVTQLAFFQPDVNFRKYTSISIVIMHHIYNQIVEKLFHH
jgi:hypothetical protein